MNMPAPSEGYRLLEKLSGTWFGGDVLTLAHRGPGMQSRMMYDLSADGIMRGMMEMSPDGAEWKVLFEAVYKRT